MGIMLAKTDKVSGNLASGIKLDGSKKGQTAVSEKKITKCLATFSNDIM